MNVRAAFVLKVRNDYDSRMEERSKLAGGENTVSQYDVLESAKAKSPMVAPPEEALPENRGNRGASLPGVRGGAKRCDDVERVAMT